MRTTPYGSGRIIVLSIKVKRFLRVLLSLVHSSISRKSPKFNYYRSVLYSQSFLKIRKLTYDIVFVHFYFSHGGFPLGLVKVFMQSVLEKGLVFFIHPHETFQLPFAPFNALCFSAWKGLSETWQNLCIRRHLVHKWTRSNPLYLILLCLHILNCFVFLRLWWWPSNLETTQIGAIRNVYCLLKSIHRCISFITM